MSLYIVIGTETSDYYGNSCCSRFRSRFCYNKLLYGIDAKSFDFHGEKLMGKAIFDSFLLRVTRVGQ